jgi:CRP-like cAMP-binding protein
VIDRTTGAPAPLSEEERSRRTGLLAPPGDAAKSATAASSLSERLRPFLRAKPCPRTSSTFAEHLETAFTDDASFRRPIPASQLAFLLGGTSHFAEDDEAPYRSCLEGFLENCKDLTLMEKISERADSKISARPDKVIFERGSFWVPDSLYIVMEGRLALEFENRKRPRGYLSPHDCEENGEEDRPVPRGTVFGEELVLNYYNTPPWTARAVTESVVVRVKLDAFVAVLSESQEDLLRFESLILRGHHAELPGWMDRIPWGSNLEQSDKALLAHRFEERHFEKGEVIVREGEPSALMAFMRGAAYCEVHNQRVGMVPSNTWVGENTICPNMTFLCTIVAAEKTLVRILTKQTITSVIESGRPPLSGEQSSLSQSLSASNSSASQACKDLTMDLFFASGLIDFDVAEEGKDIPEWGEDNLMPWQEFMERNASQKVRQVAADLGEPDHEVFLKDEVLSNWGDPADHAFVIVHGSLETRRASQPIAEHPAIGLCVEGIFGPNRDTPPRAHDIVAKELTVVRRIHRDTIFSVALASRNEKLVQACGITHGRTPAAEFVDALLKVPAFSGMSTPSIVALVQNKSSRLVRKGETVQGVWVCLSGEVRCEGETMAHEPNLDTAVLDSGLESPGEATTLSEVFSFPAAELNAVLIEFPDDAALLAERAMEALKRDPKKVTKAASRFGLLKDCREAFVSELTEQSEIKRFNAGDFFMRQGDQGTSGFFLMYGTARAEKTGTQVGEIAKGSVLGEPALLGLSTERNASVTAIGTCIAFEISCEALLPLLEKFEEEKAILERVAGVRTGVNKILVGGQVANDEERSKPRLSYASRGSSGGGALEADKKGSRKTVRGSNKWQNAVARSRAQKQTAASKRSPRLPASGGLEDDSDTTPVSPTSPESPDASSSTSRSPSRGLPLLEAKVPSQYASAVQSLLSTEQDSVATGATRPGVSPPAGQTGGGVKPHPGPAPGVGLLLAGVFVEKMLRKQREVPPQAKESEEPSSPPVPPPLSRREQVLEDEARTWAALTPQTRQDVLNAAAGGKLRPASTTYARRKSQVTPSRRRRTILEEVAQDPGGLMARAYG